MGSANVTLCSSRRSKSKECTQLLCSSVVVQKMDKATYDEVMNVLPDLIYQARQCGRDLDWHSFDITRLLVFFRVYTNPQCELEQRRTYVARLVDLGFPELFLAWWQQMFSNKLFSKSHESMMRNFRALIGIGWNATEIDERFCRSLVDHGGFGIFLKTLCADQLALRKLISTEASATNISRVLIAHTCLAILLHILRSCPDLKPEFRDANGLSVCQRYADYDVENYQAIIRCKALLCLAYAVNEDENERITGNHATLKYLLRLLNDCVAQKSHVGVLYPFSATELVEGLNLIAVNDTNKRTLAQLGIMQPLNILLNDPKNDEELCEVLNSYWTLAFLPEHQSIMHSDTKLMKRFKTLESHDHEGVVSSARGVLFLLTNDLTLKRSRSLSAVKSPNENSKRNNQHVMISYQWMYKQTVIEINEELKRNGFKTWLDVERMTGSLLEAMAEAVEQAFVIIVCLSESYKNSPSCRTEAEYTYKLKKEIIPLRMENYSPDGWLGILIGNKLYYDVSKPERLQENLPNLINDIRNRQPGDAAGTILQNNAFLSKSKSVQNYANSSSTSATEPDFTSSQETIVVKAPSERSINKSSTSSSITSSWTTEDVKNWLEERTLTNISSKLEQFDGQVLWALRQMYERAPTLYYQSVKEDLKITDMLMLLRFTSELEKLQ